MKSRAAPAFLCCLYFVYCYKRVKKKGGVLQIILFTPESGKHFRFAKMRAFSTSLVCSFSATFSPRLSSHSSSVSEAVRPLRPSRGGRRSLFRLPRSVHDHVSLQPGVPHSSLIFAFFILPAVRHSQDRALAACGGGPRGLRVWLPVVTVGRYRS